jgi:hypothetical protein
MVDSAVFAIRCNNEVVYASTEYEDVVKRRDQIEQLRECTEAHPITVGRWVMGAPR